MMRRIELGRLTEPERDALVRRSAVPDAAVKRAAAAIVEEVRIGGDMALAEIGARHGGSATTPGPVPTADMARAAAGLDPHLRSAIESAIDAVTAVAEPQRPVDHRVDVRGGVQVERRWSPMRRVGAYVPGGSAPLPSTLVMTVVPALIAGVDSIAVATPAGQGGAIDDTLLATAHLLGIGEMHPMGGAQAIAALAYGTETVRPVDKIVGPGNAWVTAAKLDVAGVVAIDMPAGPSEALVLADASADPRHVAADLLAQAEHGPDSPVVLVATDPAVIEAVLTEAGRIMADFTRRDIVAKALADHGLAVLAVDAADAIAFADTYAPEHLSIHLDQPDQAIDGIRAAGSVFVGTWAPEPVGDYASGANHVLPTGGLARSTSPLSVEDYGSWRQVQRLTRDGLEALRPTIEAFAAAEGLDAHRTAVDVRFSDGTP